MDKITEIKAIRDFFGMNGKSMPEFAAELKALSPEEKRYLAEGAARELGKELEPAKAPLSVAA